MDYELSLAWKFTQNWQHIEKVLCCRWLILLGKAQYVICPVCSGMPGVLPVVNQKAVEFAIRVALALECRVETPSLFARKNYFYLTCRRVTRSPI